MPVESVYPALEPLLPRVRKPIQYVGGEVGSVTKDWDATDVRWALLYPDAYEVGLPNQGIQILYEVLNEREGVLAERTYTVWPDLEELMRTNGVPQFTVDAHRPVGSFDVLGVSFATEMAYTNLLTVLDLAGIPLFSSERTVAHPLVIGGGHAAFNPEPVADFLDVVVLEAGAFYVMDRGYVDFERLYVFTLSAAFFVVRTKSNILLQRRYSHPVDKTTGVRSDHTVILTAINSVKAYPDQLRRISYLDVQTRKRFKFLTNNFTLPALTIALIYKSRWQVELFFKWIKQHLRIKAFFGTTENAVKTQIWIAVSVYVLVAIVRKRMSLDSSLYQILQILSVTLFEKTPILQALQACDSGNDLSDPGNQLILFDF